MSKTSGIGIDIIGFPCGKLGIGDQVRSLVKLAVLNGYDVNLIDCMHPSDNILNDHLEYKELVTNEFKHPLRIYSLTQNHIAALIYRYGVGFFNNQNNIFHLAWEFDERPKELDSALKFSDEIWGISSFTSKAFFNQYGIPVETMHTSVEIEEFEKLPRAFFNLPDDKYLFCFSFDFNSWLTRKNPVAVIEAFNIALLVEGSLGLVIKVSNVNNGSEDWLEFNRLIEDNKNIYVINETLDKSKVISLFSCCDCYISLHRSEGFGLGMAENMLLGKPVICTGFSGNMDYCSEDNSYLVDFSIITVKENEYDFSKGFEWADPSITSAAEKILEVYNNNDIAQAKATKGKITIEEKLSSEFLAKRFKMLVTNFIERRM